MEFNAHQTRPVQPNPSSHPPCWLLSPLFFRKPVSYTCDSSGPEPLQPCDADQRADISSAPGLPCLLLYSEQEEGSREGVDFLLRDEPVGHFSAFSRGVLKPVLLRGDPWYRFVSNSILVLFSSIFYRFPSSSHDACWRSGGRREGNKPDGGRTCASFISLAVKTWFFFSFNSSRRWKGW